MKAADEKFVKQGAAALWTRPQSAVEKRGFAPIDRMLKETLHYCGQILTVGDSVFVLGLLPIDAKCHFVDLLTSCPSDTVLRY